jgi:hypothetical protein
MELTVTPLGPLVRQCSGYDFKDEETAFA